MPITDYKRTSNKRKTAVSYKAELFTVEVTEKVNVDYDDNKVDCVFKFNIINDSKHDANYLKGYITISDAEGTVLASGSAWFKGDISSQNKNYHELSLDFDRGGVGERIWNADLSDLVITFRITEIHFDDGTEKSTAKKILWLTNNHLAVVFQNIIISLLPVFAIRGISVRCVILLHLFVCLYHLLFSTLFLLIPVACALYFPHFYCFLCIDFTLGMC